MGIVLVARAHPPANNAGRVGRPYGFLIRTRVTSSFEEDGPAANPLMHALEMACD